MTLQQLSYVIAISETGSYSKASEILYVAQPSLTTAVKELEKELGITIFTRGGRGASLTNEGVEFLPYARQVYQQYEVLQEKYLKTGPRRKRFGVSTQHYSFAVKAFVQMVEALGMSEYEFAIRETKTLEVIEDVSALKSEIGILYLSDFNRKIITKQLSSNRLEFHHLIDCPSYIYIWRGHPLAGRKSVTFADLDEYPCLSFEQGGNGSFYYAEEIYSMGDHPRSVKVCDRATMLNLMVGLNGYTLCSGVICEELNGTDYVAVPFLAEEDAVGSRMEIGYVTRKNTVLSSLAERYVRELDRYLKQYQETHG
jgi:DNA-binding transcriptional LysR family regulator